MPIGARRSPSPVVNGRHGVFETVAVGVGQYGRARRIRARRDAVRRVLMLLMFVSWTGSFRNVNPGDSIVTGDGGETSTALGVLACEVSKTFVSSPSVSTRRNSRTSADVAVEKPWIGGLEFRCCSPPGAEADLVEAEAARGTIPPARRKPIEEQTGRALPDGRGQRGDMNRTQRCRLRSGGCLARLSASFDIQARRPSRRRRHRSRR